LYNYQEFAEKQKLRKIIIALTIACVLVVLLSAGLNFYASYISQPETIPVVMPVAGVWEDPPVVASETIYELLIDTPHSQTRLIPLCWDTGLFYDPTTRTIPLPYGVSVVSVTQNTAYYIHEIELYGVYLPTKNRWLMYANPFVTNINQHGNLLQLRTRGPVVATYFNNGEYSYIKLVNLHNVYHTVVVIDPGHGGHDSGAINVLGRGAPSEADIALTISQKLLDYFDVPGVLLIPTRTTDEFVRLSDRHQIANRVAANYFISIHVNADDRSRLSRGMLTLYGNAPGSAELAYTLQAALAYALGARDRGISHAPEFSILRNSNVPVALLELLFLSNPEDAARMSDPNTQYLIARTIADVIHELSRKNY